MTSPPVIPAVLDRHTEEAALLWLQRNRAVVSPHHTLRSLAVLDERIEAHIDALRLAGPAGSERTWREFEDFTEPGEVFTAAVLAMEAADTTKIAGLLAAAAANPLLIRPLISAVGWLAAADAAVIIAMLSAWGDPHALHIAIGGSAIRREFPGNKLLIKAMDTANPALRARAFRAIGEFGERSLVSELYMGQADADARCRFWAAWSLALLAADPSALAELRAESEANPHTRTALRVAACKGDPRLYRAWLRGRLNDPDCRTTIIAAAASSEVEVVSWLLDQLANPIVARLTGEAITTITGADLTKPPLGTIAPQEYVDRPNDDPNHVDVAMDVDSDLPWPDAKALRDWWTANRGQFPAQTRLLLGRPITPDWLRQVLAHAGQRVRMDSAIELAALKPGRPLIEVRAPAWRPTSPV